MITDTIHRGTFDIEGFLLQYQIEGQGPTAMVIGSAHQYPPLFSQYLRQHLKLVFIDQRVFVNPPPHLKHSTVELETLIEDIETMRQTLNLDRVIVIGHSGYAYMALEYAKKYSEHVSHVVMIAISPSLSADYQQQAELFWQDFATPERKAVHAARLQELSDTMSEDSLPHQRFIKEYTYKGAKYWYDFNADMSFMWDNTVFFNMNIFNHIWRNVFHRIDVTQGLAEFNKPIFLALGLHDFALAPFTVWYPIRQQFKNIELSLFTESGHAPQWEESKLFDARLLNWLRQSL